MPINKNTTVYRLKQLFGNQDTARIVSFTARPFAGLGHQTQTRTKITQSERAEGRVLS